MPFEAVGLNRPFQSFYCVCDCPTFEHPIETEKLLVNPSHKHSPLELYCINCCSKGSRWTTFQSFYATDPAMLCKACRRYQGNTQRCFVFPLNIDIALTMCVNIYMYNKHMCVSMYIPPYLLTIAFTCQSSSFSTSL